jgi:hypothetical protein
MDATLDQLAFRFFKLFAQYEYALKVLGYAKAGKQNQAEVEWDRFSADIGKTILNDEDPRVVEARQYIFEKPPKRQIWVNDAIDWAEVPNNERSSQILYSHIRRVRNNLYHGGKFNGRWIDPDRSRELLSGSLLLLEKLVATNAQLSDAIHGNAF